jgi:transglutaminase-like putative cysteine protease
MKAAELSQRLTRDKADTLLLLAGALLVIAPHFAHLPLWTSAAACATLLWRASITWRGKRMPPIALLLPVAVAAMIAVWRSYGTVLGRDPGVAMLTLLLAFKLLEMHARRDLYVVCFLSFFLMLTSFFYSQTILAAISMLLTIVVLLTAQITFQYTGAVPPLMQRLRTALKILLLASPLAALLFVVFPRIQGPLWGLPGDARMGRSGISDTMAPGTMSSLAQSGAVAFRVRFDDPVPAQPQLYWRGIVLSQYDGRTWSRLGRPLFTRGADAAQFTIQLRGKQVRHQVTMEPTSQRYLFTLEMTAPKLTVPDHRVIATDELESLTMRPLQERVRYSAASYPEYRVQAGEEPDDRRKWLQLPRNLNPRAVAMGRAAREQEGPDGGAIASRFLQMFRQQNYVYTLEPPLLGRDSVDEFLFNTRQGFCEHYAGAFVVLMRAAGIPSRVVTGYQGGELNPVDGFLTVRQSDAHAWAEIWLPGRGWQRVDPTGAVAPERIRNNLARAIPQQAPFGLGGLMALQNDAGSWLSQLRYNVYALNNAWNQWVLDYNAERQRNFLQELSSIFGNWRTAAALAGLAALAWLWRGLRARVKRDPVDAAWSALRLHLAQLGMAPQPDEGPHTLAGRVDRLGLPEEKKAALKEFLSLYGALKYRAMNDDERTRSAQRLAILLTLAR